MKKSCCIIILLFLVSTLAMCGCSESKPETCSRDIFAMDTYINCQVAVDSKELAEAGLKQVEETFLEIDRLTNRFSENSDVYKVNKNAGIAPVKVSTDVYAIVETAIQWSDKTGGAFNILIGSVMNLWGFGTDYPAVPEERELEEALTKLDYKTIQLDSENSTIFLPQKGMVIDLGGVAKGYATDKAVEALKDLGIKNALINAGGNVYALGCKVDGSPWRIGVQDPREPQGVAALLEANDIALVSSGDYQRYFEVDGIRYHHIIDPATGYPARDSAGTTVLSKSAAVADILSTALFVKGPEAGIALAENFSEVEAVLIITPDGKIYKTNNMDDYLAER